MKKKKKQIIHTDDTSNFFSAWPTNSAVVVVALLFFVCLFFHHLFFFFLSVYSKKRKLSYVFHLLLLRLLLAVFSSSPLGSFLLTWICMKMKYCIIMHFMNDEKLLRYFYLLKCQQFHFCVIFAHNVSGAVFRFRLGSFACDMPLFDQRDGYALAAFAIQICRILQRHGWIFIRALAWCLCHQLWKSFFFFVSFVTNRKYVSEPVMLTNVCVCVRS